MEEIEKYLGELINNPQNDIINFNLAFAYEKEKQYAASVSYYLRCAEYTNDNILSSEALVRASLCICKQTERDAKELCLIKHAITASLNSIEPYYIASLYFSWRGKWIDSYMYACMGINILENNLVTKPFIKSVGYIKHEIYYQKAFSGSNIGKLNEAREIYCKILSTFDISGNKKEFILNELNKLPEPHHPIISYSKNKLDTLKFIFNNSDKIDNNFSQIYQDMYVLSMHNGKMNGTYLEIGAGDYKNGNNTYLLETEFNWTGVSIDINKNFVNNFNQNRVNKCVCSDATTIDYIELLSKNYESTNIDYLQLDCDPPNVTFDILTKIPFDQYKFGVITYEHDFYNDITGIYREKSREILRDHGYILIAGNISPYTDKYPFEDWWIHPEVIDENIWKLFKKEDDEPINGEKYMLTKNEIINNHMISINRCVKPKIIREDLILSNTILDNFLLKNKEILNLNDLHWYENLSGINEYRFYSYLSTLFNNIAILDIGTGFGISAVALSHNENNHVISYNLINQIRDNSKIYTKKNITFKIKNVLEDLTEDFIKNIKIIMIDIDHFGEERKIIDRLEQLNYSGIVILDDIHHPWEKEGKCMKELWESINYTKYDITKYGHNTGTGIFFMNFNMNIIEETSLEDNDESINGEKYMLTKKYFLSKQNDNNIKLEVQENPKNTNNYIKIGFDIGASLGATINLFDDCDIIYAFEPNPVSFDYLQKTKNEHKNKDKIFTYNYAISDTNGTALFNIMYHDGYSSLLDFDESGNLFKHCNEVDNGFHEVRCKINVQTKRLDTFIEENNIQNIHFIKINTQGSDLAVIKSLGKYIKNVYKIEAEIQTQSLYKNSSKKNETIKFMKENNFDIVEIIDNSPATAGYEERITFINNSFIDSIYQDTKQVAFWDNQLCERGTSVAMYDYAYYNQTILGNKSYIFYDKNNPNNKKEIIEKFKKYFIVYETDDFKEVDEYLVKYNISHIYIIKSGELDSRLSKVAKNCVHCVFTCSQPHGEVYSSISPWVQGNNNKYPVVPHMINIPKNNNNMRKKLNIPKNAIVFGGYGGKENFNIKFVQNVVYNIAQNNPNIYFLFANFYKFCQDLPNIIFLPMITDLYKKVEFINTCDAMLWAKQRGETFGLAIAEFSTLNKPIIATKIGCQDLAYIHLLKDKAIWYNNEKDLTDILLNFNPEIESKKDWNAYKDYTPEKVMTIFNDVFLNRNCLITKFTNNYYPYCEKLVNMYKKYIRGDIIDIGSNIGLFSKAIIKNTIYNSLHLFEPVKEYYEYSKKSLQEYDSVYFNNYGLSNSEDAQIIYKSSDNIGWNTFLENDPNEHDHFINKMIKEECILKKLDDYEIDNVNFIKIDVEGFETKVLEGGMNLISKHKPYILVEVGWGTKHPNWKECEKIYNKLFEIGYKKVTFNNYTEDVLFEPLKDNLDICKINKDYIINYNSNIKNIIDDPILMYPESAIVMSLDHLNIEQITYNDVNQENRIIHRTGSDAQEVLLDGFITKTIFEIDPKINILCRSLDYPSLQKNIKKHKNINGTLIHFAKRYKEFEVDNDKIIHIPSRDDTYLKTIDNSINLESKINMCYWRGGCDLNGHLRHEVCKILKDSVFCNVKIFNPCYKNTQISTNIRDPNDEGKKYKIVLAIESVTCPSDVENILFSGSVPIIIYRWWKAWFFDYINKEEDVYLIHYDEINTLPTLINDICTEKIDIQQRYNNIKTFLNKVFNKSFIKLHLKKEINKLSTIPTVGLGILSYDRPNVLDRTLKSYKEKGFFDFFDEKIILLQENLPEARKIAEKYELEIYSTEENIGIGPGNNYLIDKLNTDYFIICQDDFILIEDNFTSEILESISLIEKNIINCARMRNICNPGEPCYASNRLPFPEGNLPLTHISGILYKNYIINPEKKYEEIFKKYNENTYIISSKYANYTENPCVYKREWYKNNLYELNKVDGRKAENNIQNIWEKNEYMIGMGRGIFSHNDKIPSPKIIDSFIFYHELDLLKYRLNLLDDYVDNFILVESTHTHTGKEKKLFYNENKNLFEKFKDKIIHIIVDDFPYKYPDIDIEKNQQWRNENYQRNCIKRGIDKLLLEDNDIITICDLDEIPNPKILNELKDNKKLIKLSSLKMDVYYYNLNCKINIDDWISPKIISYKEFTKLDITIHDFRYKKTDNIIVNGGWHLSYFGDKEFIANKIKNYGHQEFNNDEILKNIEEKIKSHKDLFNRENYEIQYIDIEDNENLPPKYEIYLQKYINYNSIFNIKDFYDFIPCHDQRGNDIYRVNKENLKMTLQNVSIDPSVVAINTEGYVKNKIEKLEQIDGWYWNKNLNKANGIYMKKTTNDTLVKCSKSAIPVLGTLVCTSTKWIEKQIQSIDFPVENYIIINNNENFLAEKLDILVSKGNKFIKNFKVYHMPYNLGCAEGWNMIIKSFMFAPYWIISNDDVSFTPGLLQEMNEAAQDTECGMVHGNPMGLPYLDKFGSFDLFLIKDWVIEKYGLFDTNYYPAYFEDFDYIMRLINQPIKIINKLKNRYYHGDTLDYNISGANTKKSSDQINIRLVNAKYKNFEFFIKKWNCIPEYINEKSIGDIYKYPFNNSNNQLSMSTFDLKFSREKHLLDTLCITSDTYIPSHNNYKIYPILKDKQVITTIVIDNFYNDPDKIREYALSLTYQNPDEHGAVGYRCESGRKIQDGTKELFEKLLHKSIPDGNNVGEWNYSTNGCFQWCDAKVPIVYHADSQQYAGIVYLTPDAPPNCGTSFLRHKKYKIRDNEIFSKSDWYQSNLNYKEPHLDKTPWEIVDSIGNVYNRLVIFDAHYIHAVTEYFGEDINNSRLFQLFFFNIN